MKVASSPVEGSGEQLESLAHLELPVPRMALEALLDQLSQAEGEKAARGR